MVLWEPLKPLVIRWTAGWLYSYRQREEVKGFCVCVSPPETHKCCSGGYQLGPACSALEGHWMNDRLLPSMLPEFCDGCFSLCCFSSPCLLWSFLRVRPLNGFPAARPLEWCCSLSHLCDSRNKAELNLIPLMSGLCCIVINNCNHYSFHSTYSLAFGIALADVLNSIFSYIFLRTQSEI